MLHNRNRALAFAAAVGLHGVVIALLVLLPSDAAAPPKPDSDLVAIVPSEPLPPSPPPVEEEEGAAAPPSRGESDAPSPPEPPAPLQSPTPAEPSIDPGSEAASGAGAAAGSGAGQGGEGSGRGAGTSGSGAGSGRVTPPVRVAGELTHADYARTNPPRGAAGTVFIAFRVRSDGAVDRCRVVQSSGYDILDRTTCRLVEQRFRFRPARDARGRTIDYELRTNFTWEPR